MAPVTENIGITQKFENNRRCHNAGKMLPGKSSRFIATCKTCNAFEDKPFNARVKCGGKETCNRETQFFKHNLLTVILICSSQKKMVLRSFLLVTVGVFQNPSPTDRFRRQTMKHNRRVFIVSKFRRQLIKVAVILFSLRTSSEIRC